MNTTLPHLLAFQFEGKEVEFDIAEEEVIINATEMANIFGKEPYAFLRQDQTKRFIAAMESANPAFKSVPRTELETENSPLVRTKRGRDDSGATWMHRTLALKFAAWLSSDFEVWIYQTIEQVLYAHGQRIGQEMREKARLLDRKEAIKQELEADPLFQEYLMIEFKLRQAGNRMARHNSNQLSIFRHSPA